MFSVISCLCSCTRVLKLLYQSKSPYGLNVDTPPQAHVFEFLVPSWVALIQKVEEPLGSRAGGNGPLGEGFEVL